MKLHLVIGTSLGCAALVAAATWRHVTHISAVPGGLPDHDPVLLAITAAGGPGGACILVFAAVSCILVTAGALHDMALVGTRLSQTVPLQPKRLPEQWRDALAGTDFASLAGRITGNELSIAPLALLRVLRAEMWRSYAKRLLATQTITVALAAVAIALAPYLGNLPTVLTSTALRLDALGAVAVVAAGVAAWLVVDRAIDRLADTVTRLSASWEEALAEPTSGPTPRSPAAAPGPEFLGPAVGRMAALIAEQSAAARELTAALGAASARQETLVAELCDTLAARFDALAGALEARPEARPEAVSNDMSVLGESVTQLTAAVERLADPVVRRMKLLGATDRRLLDVLRRQEEVVGTVGTKWSELVAALQVMGSGLERFASAARHDDEARLFAAPSVAGAEQGELGEELQDLLDEMSEDEPAAPRERLSR